MRILVPVKQVARLRDDAELGDPGALPADAFERQLNEWDAFSLEAAVRLAQESGDGEIVAVSVGGEQVEDVLLACLAAGADRAARIWDPALEGADPLAVAAVLAAVAAEEKPDLVLCGAQSSDSGHAATGVALAGLLGLAHAAVVDEVERDGAHLTVRRELEGGLTEVLRLALPALLTVQSAINQPRHATLRERKQAREKPLARRTPADLGISSDELRRAAGSRTVRLSERRRERTAELLEGEPAQMASRITEIIRRALRP
jgi:electron transfer flavoprotein beta subunit